MKIRVIATREEADRPEDSVAASAARALDNVQRAANGVDPIKILWQMKVGAVGCNPLEAESPLAQRYEVEPAHTADVFVAASPR